MCFGRSNNSKLHTLPAVEKVLNQIIENEMQDSLEGLRVLASPSPSKDSTDSGASPYLPEAALGSCAPTVQTSNRALTSQFQKTHALTNIQVRILGFIAPLILFHIV